MLMQTNSYLVPKEKQEEHARLVRKIRQVMARIGCEMFDVYEQSGPGWTNNEATGRFVQMMRFRDRRHQLAVQTAERNDKAAQEAIREFCELIDLSEQQQQGTFSAGFYSSVLTAAAENPANNEE